MRGKQSTRVSRRRRYRNKGGILSAYIRDGIEKKEDRASFSVPELGKRKKTAEKNHAMRGKKGKRRCGRSGGKRRHSPGGRMGVRENLTEILSGVASRIAKKKTDG